MGSVSIGVDERSSVGCGVDPVDVIYVTVAIIVDSWNAIGLHFVYPDIWLQIWVTSFNPRVDDADDSLRTGVACKGGVPGARRAGAH